MLLEKLISKEVAEEIFDSLEKTNNFTSVSSINAEQLLGDLSGVSTWTFSVLWIMEKAFLTQT